MNKISLAISFAARIALVSLLLGLASTVQAQDLPADAIAISPADAVALNLGRLYRLSSWQPNSPPLPPGMLFSIPGMEENGGLTNAVYFSPSAAALFVDDRAAVATQMLAEAGLNQNQMLFQDDEEGGDMGEGFSGGLWLEPGLVVSNVFNVLLHGATNDAFYLVTSTEYLDPATNCTWLVEGSFQGTDDPTPFAVGIGLRTNSQTFLRVQACDDCASAALPLFWQLNFFGVTGVDPMGDYNADGTNNLTHFLDGSDPNAIAFSLTVTNQYVAADSVPVQLNIAGGVPSYIAVLVNDTNTAGASWQPFASTSLSVPTLADGTYVITVGLCGLATNATQFWQTLTVFRDSTPLGIGLTNLASLTGSRPFIDPAGYATRALSALTWTVTNATATNTGSGAVVAQDWSLSDRWHTTNWLQCLDLALALGTNWVSIEAVDWAGSIAVTNFQYVFDTNGDLTPPALTLAWPPDGALVSGDNFTGQGWLDDDTASVALQYTDGGGILQTINGIVERGGNVWLPSVPLAPGTNRLTLFATDAAGNVSTSNFSVVQSSTTMTITPITGDLLNYAYGTVDVYVSDPATSVTVNGVTATDIGFGVWEAVNVPLSPGGSVTLLAVAHLASGDTVQALLKLQRGPIVFTQTYDYKLDYSVYDWASDGTNGLSTHHGHLHWARGAGGTGVEADAQVAADGTVVSSNWMMTVWPPDNGYLPTLPGQTVYQSYFYGALTGTTTNTADVPDVEWVEDSTCAGSWPEEFGATWTESSARETHLFTGGDAARQSQAMFILTASLTRRTVLHPTVPDWYTICPGTAFAPFLSDESPPVLIPPQQISLGAVGSLDQDAELPTMQSDGRELVITPKTLAAVSLAASAAPPPQAAPGGGQPSAPKYMLVPTCVSPCPANRNRLTLGVGEEVNVVLSPGLNSPADSIVTWSAAGGSVSTLHGNQTMFTAPSNAAPAAVIMQYKTATFTTNFTVVPPSGVARADVVQRVWYDLGISGAGMQLTIYLAPTNVSFYRVQCMEVGQDASGIWGYYTQFTPQDLGHTSIRGANSPITVGYDNSWNHSWDTASWLNNAGPWSAGGFTWVIPAKWWIPGSATNDIHFSDQVFRLDASGTMAVSKFGHTVTRQVNENYGIVSP